MDIGGVIHGEWEDETDPESGEITKRRTHALVWGEMTLDAKAVENNTKRGISRNISFRVRIAKKQFVRCTIYAGKRGKPDPSAYWLAYRLKQNDPVILLGNFVVWPYRNRKDNEIHYGYDMYPSLVLPYKAFTDPDEYAAMMGSGIGADPMYGLEDAVPQGYGGELPEDEGDPDGEEHIPY